MFISLQMNSSSCQGGGTPVKDTKTRILDAALDLFSRDGYEEVGIERIAAAVGIKGPSIYKHFRSKQDIFDTLINEMTARYEENTPFSGNDGEEDISPDTIMEKTVQYIRFSIHDPSISKIRRLLTIEQFRNSAIAAIQERRSYNDLLHYYGRLFRKWISRGILKDADPDVMALQYIAPVSIQLYRVDRDPSLEEEAVGMIEEHVSVFFRMYRNEGSI
ncbi:MAG: TetR/AcrR family transcriptional regulator [Clostridiales bacterium]|nr:TetR/AcrR family transcriptional regulator [Clostridiales bacterium]